MTYLDPFLGPKIGTLYITDYKMYFIVSLPTVRFIRLLLVFILEVELFCLVLHVLLMAELSAYKSRNA